MLEPEHSRNPQQPAKDEQESEANLGSDPSRNQPLPRFRGEKLLSFTDFHRAVLTPLFGRCSPDTAL